MIFGRAFFVWTTLALTSVSLARLDAANVGRAVHNKVAKRTDSEFPTIYGVNYGNWLVSEPWMSPTSWLAMGGEFCPSGDCSVCRQSEWSLSKYLGDNGATEAFQKFWQSWLTQEDVDGIVAAKLNTVRIPLGFWLIEDIVDTSVEFYPKGGLDELIRGLQMFKAAGIRASLDHHALPGVSSSKQMFAGNCTDQVTFYNSPDDHNYRRAVTWGIVMTYLSHTHPAFSTVFGIEAINEPEQNASNTPGLDRYEKAFVLGVRAIEAALGIICGTSFAAGFLNDTIALGAFSDAIPIIFKLSAKYNIYQAAGVQDQLKGITDAASVFMPSIHGLLKGHNDQSCLSTTFMNKAWQNNNPTDPAQFAHGPQSYDAHLYLNFGGVAPNATEDSYLQTICNNPRIKDAIALGNTPIYNGEWSLSVGFNTTDDFLKKYGDAQKLSWSAGNGWAFWNWKVDNDAQTYPILDRAVQWSYRDALKLGLLTADPADYFDADVCEDYITV